MFLYLSVLKVFIVQQMNFQMEKPHRFVLNQVHILLLNIFEFLIVPHQSAVPGSRNQEMLGTCPLIILKIVSKNVLENLIKISKYHFEDNYQNLGGQLVLKEKLIKLS